MIFWRNGFPIAHVFHGTPASPSIAQFRSSGPSSQVDQEGGTAADTWNRIVTGQYTEEEKQRQTQALLDYCGLDTLAMVKIWEVLTRTIE